MDEDRVPDFELKVYLVSWGYQADLFINGQKAVGGCRDFADNQDIDAMREWLLHEAGKLVDRFHNQPFPKPSRLIDVIEDEDG